jgi:hypothetical protein
VEAGAVAAALASVLERIDLRGEAIVTAGEAEGWGPGVLDTLIGAGVLFPHTNATGVICTECEEECWVEPWAQRRPNAGEVLVALCEPRDDIHLVRIDPERLRQWRADMEVLGEAVKTGLGISDATEPVVDGNLWLLGQRRLGGRATRVYLAPGFRPAVATELAGIAHEHIVGPSAVLLVPASKPKSEIWPQRTIPCLSIKDIARASREGLTIDEAAILHSLGRQPKAPPAATFPMPPNPSWDQIYITFIDEHRVHIRVGHEEGEYSFADMGMTDARTGEPNAAWILLRALAGAYGEMGWEHPESTPNNRQRMRLLRNHLREFFSLEGNPFKPYRKGVGWVSKFTLRPPPA